MAIEIKNEELWGKIIAEETAAVDGNRALNTREKVRFINALAKAAVRIERSGTFMDFDHKTDTLLIWSDSNEIYVVNGDKTCKCKAAMNGNVCWHRAAKRLASRYVFAEHVEAEIEYMQTEDWSQVKALQMFGLAPEARR